MSLILDALRKAEAERKLGHTPTLATVSPWRVQRRVPLHVVVLIVLLGVIAVLGGMLWFSRQEPQAPGAAVAASARAPGQDGVRPPSHPARPDGAASTPAGALPPPPPAEHAPRPAAKPQAARTVPPAERLPTVVPASPPVPHVEPERTAAPATPAPAPAPPRNVLPELPKPLPAPASPSAPPQTTAPVAPSAPPGGGPSSPRPEPAPTSATATPAPGAGAQASASPTAPPPTTAPAPGPAPAVGGPSSPSARSALGELKLTLHYYNADASRRFVILNGERYAQGQSTAKGMKVSEIRPDGVVCEYQGETFFLPRSGG